MKAGTKNGGDMTKNNSGFGLVETILALGALSALSLAIYMVLGPASATAQVKREQDNLRDISTATERSFGLLGSFAGVSTSRLMADGLVPARMRDGNSFRTAWGAQADVFPHTVSRANDSFLVVYPLAPAEVCTKLAAVVARDAFDIRVGGVSVMNGGGLDLAHAAQACGADGATMEFVYHSGLVAGTAVAAAPLALAPTPPSLRPPPGPPAIIVVGDASDVGDAGGVVPVALPPGGGAPSPPPPAAVPVPGPAVVATPGTPGTVITPPTFEVACTAPAPATQTVYTCNLGQYGSREQQASFSCPEAWEAPLMGSWATVSSNCAACPAPAVDGATEQNQPRSQACPVGQSGSWTWEEDRTRTRSVSYNCPAGTAALPPATYGGWSAYVWSGTRENEVNSCAPTCVAPAPTMAPTTRALADQNQTIAACPAGQYGQVSQTRTVSENGTITTTWSCPGPASSAATAWLGTFNFGIWSDTSNACTACPAPSVETDTQQNQPRSLACPAGWTGSHSWEEDRTRTRSVSYNCPAGTAALPPASYTAWTAFAWSGTRENEVNTCVVPGPVDAGCWGDGGGNTVVGWGPGVCLYGATCEYRVDTTGTQYADVLNPGVWSPIPAQALANCPIVPF